MERLLVSAKMHKVFDNGKVRNRYSQLFIILLSTKYFFADKTVIQV